MHDHHAIGHHAIHIEQQQPDRARLWPEASCGGSDHLHAPQIVQVDDALDRAAGIHDDDRRDLVGLHDLQRFDREEVRGRA